MTAYAGIDPDCLEWFGFFIPRGKPHPLGSRNILKKQQVPEHVRSGASTRLLPNLRTYSRMLVPVRERLLHQAGADYPIAEYLEKVSK